MDAGTADAMPSVMDLHAHPSMKTYFGRARLLRRRRARKGFAPFALRTSYPSLRAGGVTTLWSSVYVPERPLLDDCWIFRLAALVMPRLRAALRSPDPAAIAHRMLDHVEAEVDRVNHRAGRVVLEVARSNAELDRAHEAGRMAFIHSLEGGHVLSHDVANVRAFRRRGVCSITLAHFYPNGVAPPVDAIPDDFFLRRFGCFQRRRAPDAGLPALGHAVVEEMRAAGVIVDLTHSTPRARRDVYALPDPHHRPLVMTHTGLATLRDVPINANPDDIRAIADSGGVIGIIFYNHWLTDLHTAEDTLDHVVRHVRALADLGGEECVAFGSDFDGMTTPPDDLREPADWPRLRNRLVDDGFTPAQVEKFLGGNARRVLRDGWG